MKRRNSIITLLLTLSMVFSTSAFAVFADTTTEQEEQIVKDAPATEEVVNETPEEPAAALEQPAEVQEQGTEAVEPAGELKPAEEPTAETKEDLEIVVSDGTRTTTIGPDQEVADGQGWKYVKATKTLTLTDFAGTDLESYILFWGTDLNIVLQGNNTVSGGIWSLGDNKLVISGSGSLNNGAGIEASTVDIKGGNITIKSEEVGIIADDIVISGGTIKVTAYEVFHSNNKISFSGDIYVDAESVSMGPHDVNKTEMPAVFSELSIDKNPITLSDDLQIVLPENAKFASYDEDYAPSESVNVNKVKGTMIADASGNPAKHVIIDRVKNPSGMLLAKAVAKGKTNMAISWTAMNDVDGYDVFFARCNTKSKKFAPELVASVDKGTTSYTVSGLKKGTAYKAYVQAYIMKSGAKQYVGKSLSTHAYAGGSSKKYTNPKSVKVKKAKVSIKKGKTYKINASVRKLKKSKKLISTEHAKKLRYLSSNTSIATVSKKGKIKAVTPGTCTVYAIAANGVYKTVNVTVK